MVHYALISVFVCGIGYCTTMLLLMKQKYSVAVEHYCRQLSFYGADVLDSRSIGDEEEQKFKQHAKSLVARRILFRLLFRK